MGGVVAKIIPRNSTIPASAQEMFTTGVENQTGSTFTCSRRTRAGQGLPVACAFSAEGSPGPAGLARIEVKFLIDASGILQVAARTFGRGRAFNRSQPSYGLDDAEVERSRGVDRIRRTGFFQRQLIEARNEAEAILLATKRRSRVKRPKRKRSFPQRNARTGRRSRGVT